VIGLGLDSDVPAHLSKRQVTNKAINSFLENVRNKKLSYTRRPAHNVDAEVSCLRRPTDREAWIKWSLSDKQKEDAVRMAADAVCR
jgi:hypothetical protein